MTPSRVLRFRGLLKILACSLFVSGLPVLAAADRPMAIPIELTHAQNFDPSPSPDGKIIYFTNCARRDYVADCEILTAQFEESK